MIKHKTTISSPWNNKLVFRYKIFNQNNRLVSRAQSSLVFAEKETGQLVSNPDEYLAYFARAQVGVTS